MVGVESLRFVPLVFAKSNLLSTERYNYKAATIVLEYVCVCMHVCWAEAVLLAQLRARLSGKELDDPSKIRD